MERIWRSYQQGPLAFRAHAPEYRKQQGTLTQPRMICEDFSECATRPAAARQFCVEFGKAAGYRRDRGAGQVIAAPHIRARQNLAERQCSIHVLSVGRCLFVH